MVKYGFKLLMFILWLFAPCYIFGAEEIRDTINYQWGVQLNEEQIKGCPYSAQFVFESLPELGKATTVDVKFQAHQFCYQEPSFNIMHTWSKAGELGPFECSEIEPRWIPPIKKDDIYQGKFGFKPDKPGDYVMAIQVTTSRACTESPEQIFHIFLSFDDSGKLLKLQGRETRIGDDRIILNYEEGEIIGNLRIIPPLSLNDTSRVFYGITVKDPIPRDVRISLTGSQGLDIIQMPEKVSGVISSGYRYKGGFKILPSRVGQGYFVLRVEEVPQLATSVPRKKDFKVIFNFDEKGKLKSIDKEVVSRK
ncbi:MAG: hypothetical protein MUP17_08145 [candidate division Zixibacteria bacterium]|nr:hypothetical protein [candidate division Zixibacteria bacterium]